MTDHNTEWMQKQHLIYSSRLPQLDTASRPTSSSHTILITLRRSRAKAVLCGCECESFEKGSWPGGMWAVLR